MRYSVAILTWGFALAALAPLAAEEPPHLEFVRGLRAKHLPDLALEYLQELGKKKLPKEVAALLPFELAKTQLELATLEADEGRRAAMQAAARTAFEAFLKSHARHPRAAEANLEIARLAVLQGRSQLIRARRQETPALQRSEMLKARARFEEAGRLLKAAGGQLDKQLAALGDPQTVQARADQHALAEAKLLAEFDQGLNLFDQAQTYSDDELQKRGAIVKSAIDVLSKVAARASGHSLCLQAKAWIGRCYQEIDDPKSARKYYADVINEKGDYARTARRWARYFLLQVLAKETDPKRPTGPLERTQKAAESWLAEYREFHHAPEGQGVRFELANAYLMHAGRLYNPKAAQNQQMQARELFGRAQKLFHELEQTENEFAEKARENKLNIILTLSSERSKGDITKLKDFEESYLRAQFEIALLNKAEKDLKDDKLEEKRKEHLTNMLEALNRALDLADAKVPAQDLGDARYLLARAYFTTGEYYRAVVVGEDLARTAPRSPRAPISSTYALYALTQILAQGERARLGPEILDADRARLRNLAEYIEKTWPNDSAADVARHQLGRLQLIQRKYPEAVETLSRVTPAYGDSSRALYQLAYAALQAQEAEVQPPKGKPSYQNRAIAALKSIPEPPQDAAPATTQVYLEAKLMLGSVLYPIKDYRQMEAIATTLLGRLAAPTTRLDGRVKTDLEARSQGLKLLALYGQAEDDYTAGRYTKVRDALEAVVKQLKVPAQAAKLAEIKDPGLLPGLLGLAVRANVQDNKIEKAREVLDVLQKSSPENSSAILRQLVQQLRAQIQELRQKGDAVKPKLDQTISNFSTFLDQLAKQQEKKPEPEMLLFLAQSYSSLDNHKRAADLLEGIPEPKLSGKEEDIDADARKVQVHRAGQILAARELRLDKQYDRSKALLDRIIGTSGQPGWAYHNLDAQKERIFLLQDQELYGGRTGAILSWNALMKQMQPRMRVDAKVKDQYFESYYYLTYCLYKNATKLTDSQKKMAGIRQAANYIVQLEATQPDMGGEATKKHFEELLQSEELLRAQYEQLKKGSN